VSSGLRPYARITFGKHGVLRFVGHLDVARVFDRAVRRARLPVAYSEGFNPRAKLSFGPPLPVGAEGDAELCILELAKPLQADEIRRRLGEQLPKGLAITHVETGRRGRRSPLADMERACYEAELVLEGSTQQQVGRAAEELMQLTALEVQRNTKRGPRLHDMRPDILALELREGSPPTLAFALRMSDGPTTRPSEVISAIARLLGPQGDISMARLTRTSLV